MVYEGPNRPITPVDDPYAMFNKLYGQRKDQESVRSILDDLQSDLAKLRTNVSQDDRRLLDEHEALVREFEKQLSPNATDNHAVPSLDPKVEDSNDNIPTLTRMQTA
jgi:hypothetical protein